MLKVIRSDEERMLETTVFQSRTLSNNKGKQKLFDKKVFEKASRDSVSVLTDVHTSNR